MQIKINEQILCNGHERVLGQAQGPVDELLLDSNWAVQPRKPIRASGSRPINRGGESGTIGFTVEVEHATRSAALTWLKTHKAAIIRQGVLKLIDDGPDLVYEHASLSSMRALLIGVLVRVTYQWTVGKEGASA